MPRQVVSRRDGLVYGVGALRAAAARGDRVMWALHRAALAHVRHRPLWSPWRRWPRRHGPRRAPTGSMRCWRGAEVEPLGRDTAPEAHRRAGRTAGHRRPGGGVDGRRRPARRNGGRRQRPQAALRAARRRSSGTTWSSTGSDVACRQPTRPGSPTPRLRSPSAHRPASAPPRTARSRDRRPRRLGPARPAR